MGARPSTYVQQVQPVEEVVSIEPMVARTWSGQQEAIFDWFARRGLCGGSGMVEIPATSPGPGEGEFCIGCHACEKSDLIVRARAGTGKTTTIIEGVNRAPESSILLCAFNKRIATELNSRITNSSAEAKTLHALGFAAIRNLWRQVKVTEGATRGDYLTNKACPTTTPKPICRLVTSLHTKARDMVGRIPSYEELTALALFFDYVPDEGWGEENSLDMVVKWARAAMMYATDNEPGAEGIDFADMIFLPLMLHLLKPTYDLGVCDEVQDMTLAQLQMFQQVCKGGRLCVVGDDKQAIYGFRGADSGSLDRLKAELQAEELPLTTTYRCAQSIVRQAQTLVPDIQAAPTNPEGLIDDCLFKDLLEAAEAGDFILSRLNAPLVRTTLALLKRKKRAKMAGRDIGAGINSVLRKLKCKETTSIADTLSKLRDWEVKQSTKLASCGLLDLVDRCHDQADMIRSLAEEAEDMPDLINRIEWLFTDDLHDPQILCSSIHKAKGLEAKRVYILQESLYRQGPSQEEDNCAYVAWTRAIAHLTFVTEVPGLERRR